MLFACLNRFVMGLPVALVCLLAGGSALAQVRVASTSLCADEFVLTLADRSQVASLSWQSTGRLAALADRAVGLPVNHGELEEIIAANADIVVIDGEASTQMVTGLKRLGIPTVSLGFGSTFDDVKTDLRAVAAAIGRVGQGQAVIADLDRRIAALERSRPPENRRPIVAYYRPGGGGAADETSVNTAIELGGFRNIQKIAGQTGWTDLNYEDAALHPPQAYITSYFDTNKESLAAALEHNPMLRQSKAIVMDVPSKFWSCTGPSLIRAAEDIARQRQLHFPDTASQR